MANEDEIWAEQDRLADLGRRALFPCKCAVCGEVYLSAVDAHTGLGKRCPLGHEQTLHAAKCHFCMQFEWYCDEYGESADCGRGFHELNGWPFQNGCKHFKSHPALESRMKTWEQERKLMDAFAKTRKANVSMVMITPRLID